MLIDETACEDTRIEAAPALAMGEGKGEEDVSRIVRILLVILLPRDTGPVSA
jgi:hypothetical protein